MNENLMSLRVWGDFACFTRPEMKVERVSYPLMTPSAARGVLEAIFWEPQMCWLIDSIRVIKRGRWISFKRNEVQKSISIRNAQQWMQEPQSWQPIQAGGGADDGTQRNTLALEDVEYLITAELRLTELGKKTGQTERKYREEFERRAKYGKCYHRPGLGMREFAADFEWEDDPGETFQRRGKELLNQGCKPSELRLEDEALGLMLYDLFDHQQRAEGFRWLAPEEFRLTGKGKPPLFEGVSVKPQAAFFFASVKDSRMDCHPERVRMVTMPREEQG